jgi:hypothetical protein
MKAVQEDQKMGEDVNSEESDGPEKSEMPEFDGPAGHMESRQDNSKRKKKEEERRRKKEERIRRRMEARDGKNGAK